MTRDEEDDKRRTIRGINADLNQPQRFADEEADTTLERVAVLASRRVAGEA